MCYANNSANYNALSGFAVLCRRLRRKPARKIAPPAMQEEPVISPVNDNKTGQKKNIKIEEYVQELWPRKWIPNGG